MEYAISPHFRNTDFPSDMSLDQKIEVFADRVTGWQLDMAQLCANASPHSGFAVLHIVFSYFEMIAKFQDGFTNDGERGTPERYFSKGFNSVFPNLSNPSPEIRERLLKKLYKDVRCGLYHAGITGPNIELSGNFDFSVAFASQPDIVKINPHRLVPDLKQHFQSYIHQLRDHKNEELRKNFETRFDYSYKSVKKRSKALPPTV
jgi:hypothetical protein